MDIEANAAGVVLPGQGRIFSSGRSTPQVKIESAPDRSFAVFEAVQPAGVPGPPRHVHRAYDEAWYILDGIMEFELDAQTLTCLAGAVVFAPRGTAHTFMNPGPALARMLAVTTADALPLIEELGRLTTAGPPDFATLGALLARHDTYIDRR